ncbi:sulfonate ABC transporter substrate-binding protein [Candidatus Methylocalor cossyra]|uniref:Aliphatic sulfonate ABC transporter periplasmic binding protein n=1 Tax=Candidatus Methylocalor cossyra TaxID=3108543 RepID=A0ABM9NH39_9GAMM
MRRSSRWMEALALLVAGLLLSLVLDDAGAATPEFPPEFRIGYQKFGTLILLKARGDLEQRLTPQGVRVVWAEFPYGPPMLEALNAGRLDFATTGETPPVFAQAVPGSPLVYVGHEPPSPESEAVIVPAHSPIRTLSDLKGKKIAVAKGSNAHYLLVAALQKAGLSLQDVQPVYLAPADARAAFERGAVDAWSIWDFYRAAAELRLQARTLTDGRGLVANFENYTSRRPFAERYPALVKLVLEEIARVDAWAAQHPETAAALLSKQVGVDADILLPALKRRSYGAGPVSAEFLANQQKVADTLAAIGLIPQPVRVAEATLARIP